ncbi:MAG: FAD-dependent monooxygenase [Pirellulales bacterium]|nr:FAD-dependent monooxygenase [Pirellulales bacterium]
MSEMMDVLVVGAGPVGLMTAAELHRHGVRCRLIERLLEPSPHCKALGITPRTLEVWDDLAIVHQALTAGMGLRGLVNIANGTDMEISSAALPEGAYGFLTLAQYDAEQILAEHLGTLAGGAERGVELVSLAQTEDLVTVGLKHLDGSVETVQAKYVVGCDGGRSAVRHALDLHFEGEHYAQVFMLADIDIDWTLERGYGYKLARIEKGEFRGAGACIPVPGDSRRYRFSTVAPEEMLPQDLTTSGQAHWASDEGPPLEAIQEMLDYLYPAGAKASNLRWSSFYRISHRLVPRYSLGRVFLAGDAAHLHPPLGGQGMNAGLQDAYNLAWKLALAVRGRAADKLLDSYHAERHEIGRQIVERTTARMNRVMEGDVDEQEPLREDSQLWLHYRDSPWVANEPADAAERWAGPLAGDRAPDVTGLRRPYVRHDERLFDLLRGPRHTLLLYSSESSPVEDGERFLALATELRARYGSLVQVLAIVHADSDVLALEGLPMLSDGRNEFAHVYVPQSGSGFLVRPDGYVGYRAEAIDHERLFRYLAGVLRAS